MDVAQEQRGRRKGQGHRYRPPEEVHEATLGELLEGVRPIPADQQKRLGFEEGRGPRVWYAGDAELLCRPCVAIVGTREVSDEGAARARRLAKELSAAGAVVVSGLARGVDTEAMTSALRSGGRTIGVLGTPLDKVTPKPNARLQEEIYASHLLLSQFPKSAPVTKRNFPARNKLMAAVSDATVIIEASDTSGTLHQAAECARLQRWLFIAKSVVDDPNVSWPKKFLGKPRTAVLQSSDDVLAAIRG